MRASAYAAGKPMSSVSATTHAPISRLFWSHVRKSVSFSRRFTWLIVGASLNQKGMPVRL
jgi:hypothetical protein